jgi:hypothetical protein
MPLQKIRESVRVAPAPGKPALNDGKDEKTYLKKTTKKRVEL